MKKHLQALAFIGISQTLSSIALADENLDQLLSLSLEELMATKVTISTQTQQTLAKAPSAVSVITAEDIKATGSTNVTDILQSIPGIYVKDNLFGLRPQVTFRGASTGHTLLMVNGEPIKDLVWALGIFWKGLPSSMIDRVEIIRGPGSALYGSDASAGVVNVITKSAAGIAQSEAGVRVGGFDTQEGWVQRAGNWNGFDIAVTAQISHTDGHNPLIAVDGQTAKDKKFGTSASYAPGYANYGYDNEDLRLAIGRGNWRLLADHTRQSNLGIGLTGAAVLDPLTRASADRTDLAVLYNNATFAADWGLNAELRYHDLNYTSGDGFQENPPAFKDATGIYPNGFLNQMRAAERGFRSEVSALYSGLRLHAIRVGGGLSAENLYSVEQFVNKGTGPDGRQLAAGGPLVDISNSPYAFAPQRTRQIRYLFLQDVWTFSNDWELTAGARYDRYSDFGSALNPRAALVWQSTERLTTKLMYGQAFRAPSYLELYSLTAANIPNPKLTPERSKTWDLSFSYLASKDLNLGLDLYRFAQFNLIAPDASNQFQNMGNNTARGIELEARWQATKTLRVTGNLSDRRESIAFNAVPKQKAYLRLDWAFMPMWKWNIQANWIGERALSAGDPRLPLAAYTLVDTTLRYAPNKEWEFAASLRNVFDVDAREYSSSSIPNNLPLPRRTAFAEMRYKF